VQDLLFAKLDELFIQFWHGLWPLPDQVTVQGSGMKGFNGLGDDLIIRYF
jgi:hypothetical protein